MKIEKDLGLAHMRDALMDDFGISRRMAGAVLAGALVFLGFAVWWFHHLAPPTHVTISAGPPKSTFRRSADKFAAILKREGITLDILESQGSLENLKRLTDPAENVDIAFVQGGVAEGFDISRLESLGSINQQPLMIFYRGAKPMTTLSELEGKRIGIGQSGSGTQVLALHLLKENGILPGGKTDFQRLDADAAVAALKDGTLDAAFLAGDSASFGVLRQLLTAPGVRLFSVAQAGGYLRRFKYLNRMELPRGAIDLGKDIPSSDVVLVGPPVELVAREGLDPAITDLFLEAAKETGGGAGLFKKQGEYPAPQEHEYKLSPEAARYYKSGRSFFYRSLPFWVAGFVDRVILVILPLLVLMFPVFRLVPAAYTWRINLGMYRWYRALLVLEQDMMRHVGPDNREELQERLEHIEAEVNRMKVPAPFAGQFYELRGHIAFVRARLSASSKSSAGR